MIDGQKRIRAAYRCNRERLRREERTPELAAAEAGLREAMDAMKAKAAEQLADTALRRPCRRVLTSKQEHWTGLTRFVEDVRIPMDTNASERSLHGAALGRKNFYMLGDSML